MKRNAMINIFASMCLLALSGIANGAETLPDSDILSGTSIYTQQSRSYILALNEKNVVFAQADTPSTTVMDSLSTQQPEFEPPFFSGSNAHKYMGLATVALVGLTAITAPDDDDEGPTPSTTSRTQGTHQSLGRAAAVMAAATVTSGLWTHWDDFHIEDGFADPDNLHVMLGALGALAMMNAVSTAPGDGHPGSGMLGGAAMAVAIKLTW